METIKVETITHSTTGKKYINVNDLVVVLVKSKDNYDSSSDAYHLLNEMIEQLLRL